MADTENIITPMTTTHLLADDLAPTCGVRWTGGHLRLSPTLADVDCDQCIATAADHAAGARQRVADYLAAYARMTSLDPEAIHTLWVAGVEHRLTVADLNALLVAAGAVR